MGNATASPVIAGTAILTTQTFAVNGTATDPTTVEMRFGVVGNETLWTFGSIGSIVKNAVGSYSATLDTTGQAGPWEIWWKGTGAAALVSMGNLQVIPSPI